MSAGTGFGFALDRRSGRIYCDEAQDIVDNLFRSRWIVEATQADIERLVAMLKQIGLQSWPYQSGESGTLYSIGIEYDDGSIEKHFVTGKNEAASALLDYLRMESGTYENRMLQERKTSVNIDYLVAECGWNPNWDAASPEPLAFEDIDRMLIFKAEGPHEKLDHSRNPQETLFLDIHGGKLYHETTKTVYENITKASTVRDLDADFTASALGLLSNSDLKNWKVEQLYRADEDAAVKLGYRDIPAWSIAIQYKDGSVIHYAGDGMGSGGAPEGCYELLDSIFALVEE